MSDLAGENSRLQIQRAPETHASWFDRNDRTHVVTPVHPYSSLHKATREAVKPPGPTTQK